MLCDSIHSGAYAARDDVLEAAQKGRIVVTCDGEPDRYRSNPDRQTLTAEFWETAELEDTGHWQAGDSRWCVARRGGQGAGRDFTGLLVVSAAAKIVWRVQPAEGQATLPSAPIDEAPEGNGTPKPKRERDPTLPEKMARWYAASTLNNANESWSLVARRYAKDTGAHSPPSENSVKRMRAILRAAKK